MAESENERLGKNSKEKLEKLEKAVIAILKAIQEIEEDQGEAYMAEGEYFGVRFDG